MRYRGTLRRKNKKSFVWAIAAIIAAVCFLLIKTGIKEKSPADTTAAEGKLLQSETGAAGGEFDTAKERATETENDQAVEAALMEQESQRIINLSAGEQAAEGIVKSGLIDRLFYAAAVDDMLLERILGNSYTPNENISLSELSYLRMLYYGPDQNTYVGEMIVNQEIAADVLEIFRTLYENQYPIERMVLIDDYNADDETSMEANNTSAFNYRTIAGSSKLSNHSYGMAIDLNPKYNPYVRTAPDGSIVCQPQSGCAYADRTREFAYKIDEEDLAYQLFTQAGFSWGGNWKSVKDYQHFEKVK